MVLIWPPASALNPHVVATATVVILTARQQFAATGLFDYVAEPALALNLANDTGTSAGDHVTRDSALTGNATPAPSSPSITAQRYPYFHPSRRLVAASKSPPAQLSEDGTCASYECPAKKLAEFWIEDLAIANRSSKRMQQCFSEGDQVLDLSRSFTAVRI